MKRERRQKIKHIIMIICAGLAAILFAVSCVYMFTEVFFPKKENSPICASADVERTSKTRRSSASATSYAELSKYPSANWSTWSDVTVSGTTVWKNYWMPIVKVPAGIYTVSCDFVQTASVTTVNISARGYDDIMDVLSSASSSVSSGVISTTFEVAEGTLGFQFLVYSNCTANAINSSCRFSNFRLNAGSTAYPYIPNLNTVYEQGKDDEKDTQRLGIFKDATLSGTINCCDSNGNSNGVTYTFENQAPTFTYGGVSFNGLAAYYDNILYPLNYGIDLATVRLNFAYPFFYGSFPLYYVGDSNLRNICFIGVDGKRYPGEILTTVIFGDEYEGVNFDYSFHPMLVKNPQNYLNLDRKQIVAIEFTIVSMDIFYEVSMFTSVNGFISGYSEGYNNGLASGQNEGYNNGYSVGKSDGYSQGYSQGKVDAFATIDSSGDLADGVKSFVYALFDAPVQSFTSMFNFEVDGMNIGAIVTFVLTMSVVVFLFKVFV